MAGFQGADDLSLADSVTCFQFAGHRFEAALEATALLDG